MPVELRNRPTSAYSLLDLASPPEVTVELPPAQVVGPGPHAPRLSRRALWIIGIATLALVVRLVALSTAYDLFIDEITYTNISLSLAHGQGVVLYGHPFALHPPAAFGLWALVIRVFGLGGGTESVLLALRYVDVVLGAATCVLTFLVVERVATRGVAVAASLLIALDPLAISFDSRVMLEAPAQLAMVTMFLCLLVADTRRSGSGKRWTWLIAAGIAGGVVVTTKETFGLVALGALGAMLLTGWVFARREVLVVAGVVLLGYAVSVVGLGVSMGFGVWWNAKVGGALRLVGARQVSGFNSPQTHVSIVSRILADGTTFAVTYLLLAAGALACLGLVWQERPWSPARRPNSRRSRSRSRLLMAVWAASSAGYLVYATLFGTIEEQMYYILLLPAVICVCLWVAETVQRRPRRWKVAASVALALALLIDAMVWFGLHSARDDEYRRLVSWEAVHLPPTAVVSATDGTSQFLMQRGIIGQWATVSQLRSHHVDYVVIATHLVDQGYGIADRSFEQAVERGGQLVFAADGSSDGSLRVYDVRGLSRTPG